MTPNRTWLLAFGAGLAGLATGLAVSAARSTRMASVPAVAVTDTTDPDVRTLMALQYQLAAALAPMDSIALDSVLADDLKAINAGDQALDKASVFRVLRAAGSAFVRVVDDSLSVRRFGNVAIMTMREVVTARTDSGEVEGRLRMTEVWLKRGGRWQAVGSQATVKP